MNHAEYDRARWVNHLGDCTLCPVNPCDRGEELAAAARETLTAEQLQEIGCPR